MIDRSERVAGVVAEVRGDRSVYLLDLADAWAAEVTLMAAEAAAPLDSLPDTRTPDDLIGALFLRDRLDRALRALDDEVALPCVIAADELFRRFTAPERTRALQRSWYKARAEPWWWERVPTTGPIYERLKADWGLELDAANE